MELEQLKTTSLLPSETPISWRVYPPEYIFSEKLQTLVARGSANSRAKDIYDLILLYPKCSNAQKLKKAVSTTFAARDTNLPSSFYDYAKSLALQQIEISWSSVQLESSDMNFNSAWSALLDILLKIDEIFAT